MPAIVIGESGGVGGLVATRRAKGAARPLPRWGIGLLFAVALALRWVFAPTHNLAEDPLTVIEAAKHLLETGAYRIPSIGSRDGSLLYTPPSWPAGFPLMLAGVFAIFGPYEQVARDFTIIVSSLVAPLTAMTANLVIGNPGVAFVAGLLAAIHPLAVGFSGQVFTNNISATLFIASIYFLTSCLVPGDSKGFARLKELAQSKGRQWQWALAFLMLGFMLSARDTDVMYFPAALYLVYQARLFRWPAAKEEWATWSRFLLIATGALLVGWAPALYFNTINFGSLLVSAHYQTGIRLSPDYLLWGSDAFFGLPGVLVMGVTLVVYHFPFFAALPLLRKHWRTVATFGIMGAWVMLPMLLVNGAFPPAATGAAPRYTLPLVPFTAILATWAFHVARQERRPRGVILFTGAVIGWQALLTYPPSELFEVWPRFAYLAYYSPVYVGHPYHHYPDHTNAMVQWVREHTPTAAIIVTASRWQHFVFYGRRKVVLVDALTAGDWKRLVSGAAVYFVEDIHVAARPEIVESLKRKLGNDGIELDPVGSVKVFSPERGDTVIRAYRAVWAMSGDRVP